MIFNPKTSMRIFLIAIILSINVYSQSSNDNLDYYFSKLDKDLNESIPKPQRCNWT